MVQIDEQIAAWERSKNTLNSGWDMEVLKAGIKKEQLELSDGNLITFSTECCFTEKIPFINFEHGETVSEKKEDAIIRINPESTTIQLLIHLPEDMGNPSLEEWKDSIKNDLKKIGKKAENFRTEKLMYMDYICYEVCDQNIWTYNLTFRLHKYERKIMGNYNCLKSDKRTWGLLLEALLIENHNKL
nr:hypothetical protein [uncultured Clostridium sp.]